MLYKQDSKVKLQFSQNNPKHIVFDAIQSYLSDLHLDIKEVDKNRPWGGFFVVQDDCTDLFIKTFYPGYDLKKIKQFGDKLSLKILVVAPNEILSWQLHYRRAELWRGISGPAGYYRSKDDIQGELNLLNDGAIVQFNPQERHRLVGLDNWGIVAEFWQHTNPLHLSDENDIVRLEDKYKR